MELSKKYDFEQHLNNWKSREGSLSTDIRTESETQLSEQFLEGITTNEFQMKLFLTGSLKKYFLRKRQRN